METHNHQQNSNTISTSNKFIVNVKISVFFAVILYKDFNYTNGNLRQIINEIIKMDFNDCTFKISMNDKQYISIDYINTILNSSYNEEGFILLENLKVAIANEYNKVKKIYFHQNT